MNLSEAVGAPVKVTVGTEEIEFPRLRVRDYIDWIAEITNTRREQSRKAVPPTLQGEARFKVLRAIETDEAVFDDILALIWTPAGASKVLQKSLKKSGKSDADIERIIDLLPSYAIIQVALDVAAIVEKKNPDEKKGNENKGAPPLLVAGDSTGSSTS